MSDIIATTSKLYIVTVGRLDGSTTEASQPAKVYGPFYGEKEGRKAQRKLNKMIEAAQEDGEMCDAIAHLCVVAGPHLPKQADVVKEIMTDENGEINTLFGYNCE